MKDDEMSETTFQTPSYLSSYLWTLFEMSFETKDVMVNSHAKVQENLFSTQKDWFIAEYKTKIVKELQKGAVGHHGNHFI